MNNATQTHFTPLNDSTKLLPTGITIAFNNDHKTFFVVRTNINGLDKSAVSEKELITAANICTKATPESFMADPDLVMFAMSTLFESEQRDSSVEFWDFQIWQEAKQIYFDCLPMNAGQLSAVQEMAAA